MLLCRLIYFSRAAIPAGPGALSGDLGRILNASLKNNTRDRITGALIYDRGRFVQVLEGGRSVLNQAYQRIRYDMRHEKVTLADFAEIPAREFGAWSMAYADAANAGDVGPALIDLEVAPAEVLLEKIRRVTAKGVIAETQEIIDRV